MCPFCLATAAWIAAATVSASGAAALVVKKVATGRAANHGLTSPSTKEDRNG